MLIIVFVSIILYFSGVSKGVAFWKASGKLLQGDRVQFILKFTNNLLVAVIVEGVVERVVREVKVIGVLCYDIVNIDTTDFVDERI